MGEQLDRYSTTLTARRPAERDGVRVISPDDYDRGAHLEHDDDHDDDALVLVLERHRTYVGSGGLNFADEQFALAAAAAARSHRTG